MNCSKQRQQDILVELGYVKPFYAVDKWERIFAGYKDGDFYFSDDWNEAREISHPEALKTLKRHLPEYKIEIFNL